VRIPKNEAILREILRDAADDSPLAYKCPKIVSFERVSGPEPDSDRLMLRTEDGRTFDCQHFIRDQALRAYREAERLAAGQFFRMRWLITEGPDSEPAFPEPSSHIDHGEFITWDRVGPLEFRPQIDPIIGLPLFVGRDTSERHGQSSEVRVPILAWAETDCGERVVMLERPDGFYRIESAERINLDPETPIEAPQYPWTVLEELWAGHNRHLDYLNTRFSRADRLPDLHTIFRAVRPAESDTRQD
jgi:hypothetical protein